MLYLAGYLVSSSREKYCDPLFNLSNATSNHPALFNPSQTTIALTVNFQIRLANDSQNHHDSRIAAQLSLAPFIPTQKKPQQTDTYVAIALPHSLTPLTSFITSGLKVHSAATPTIALITNLAKNCGTSLNTMIVESSPNATTITGVSSALPARWLGYAAGRKVAFGLGVGLMGGAAMLRRSDGSSRNAVSEETIGACSASQER